MSIHRRIYLWLLILALVASGCGTSKTRLATEQLLMSDAVDRTIAQISFHPLAGKKVYFDNKYIRNIKGLGFVNADYVTSSLRQHMVAAGCLLQEDIDDADYVVEARVGALGTDGHEITYGMPASTALADAASVLPTAPRIPLVPEISVAKKHDIRGAAKIGVFAYHRETREPIWQSGIAVSTSNAKDAWILGAGPFQFGTIYDGAQFAGSQIHIPLVESEKQPYRGRLASYFEEFNFEEVAEGQRLERDLEAKNLAQAKEGRSKRNLLKTPELLPPGIDAEQAKPVEASIADSDGTGEKVTKQEESATEPEQE